MWEHYPWPLLYKFAVLVISILSYFIVVWLIIASKLYKYYSIRLQKYNTNLDCFSTKYSPN